MTLATITVTLSIEGDDTASNPAIREALDSLADVMLVQAEDGLWSLGSPDTEGENGPSEYLRGIGSSDVRVTIDGPSEPGLLGDLRTAKRNVIWLLDHPRGLVDFHALPYWAGRVESLRQRLAGL